MFQAGGEVAPPVRMSYFNPISLPPRLAAPVDRSRTVSGTRRTSAESSEREVELADAVELSSNEDHHPDQQRKKRRPPHPETGEGASGDEPPHLDLTA